MAYQPNPTDATSTYRAAAAWKNNVPLDAIAYPSVSDVGETGWGEYHIIEAKQQPARHHQVALLALCTYDGEAEVWEVYLPDSDTVIVRVEGDEFIVIPRE